MKKTNQKELRRLCHLFMEGKTSVEQEDLLAEHFRHHPAPKGLESIAAMFDIFATGMPVEGAPIEQKPRVVRRPLVWLGIASCAAAVAVFLLAKRTPMGEGGCCLPVEEMPVATAPPPRQPIIIKEAPVAEQPPAPRRPEPAKPAASLPPARPLLAEELPIPLSEPLSSPADSLATRHLLALDAVVAEAEERLRMQADEIEREAEYLASLDVVEVQCAGIW